MSDRDFSVCMFCAGKGGCEYSVLSKFFARRAMDKDSHVIENFHCGDCGSRMFKITVSDKNLEKLYKDYRSDEYFEQRHHYEPWYTRKFNDDIGSEAEIAKRRQVFLDALAKSGAVNEFSAVLDHGGDRGQMIRPEGGLNAKARFVCDLSNVTPDPGVIAITPSQVSEHNWDLILTCHVLEHVVSPRRYLEDLIRIGNQKCWYFIEVPDERYRVTSFSYSYIP